MQAAAHAPPNHLSLEGAATDPASRITVDIQGADLRHDYSFYLKREPLAGAARTPLRSLSHTAQVAGALLITALSVVKLWEDIRLLRKLRRELSSITASVTDRGGAGAKDPQVPKGRDERGGRGQWPRSVRTYVARAMQPPFRAPAA